MERETKEALVDLGGSVKKDDQILKNFHNDEEEVLFNDEDTNDSLGKKKFNYKNNNNGIKFLYYR